jgi:hypothetical protein
MTDSDTARSLLDGVMLWAIRYRSKDDNDGKGWAQIDRKWLLSYIDRLASAPESEPPQEGLRDMDDQPLGQWLHHSLGCLWHRGDPRGCDCGLTRAMLAATPAAQPAIDVGRLRCGRCGDDLLLSEIEGHLNSEGRTL